MAPTDVDLSLPLPGRLAAVIVFAFVRAPLAAFELVFLSTLPWKEAKSVILFSNDVSSV